MAGCAIGPTYRGAGLSGCARTGAFLQPWQRPWLSVQSRVIPRDTAEIPRLAREGFYQQTSIPDGALPLSPVLVRVMLVHSASLAWGRPATGVAVRVKAAAEGKAAAME